MIPVRGSTFSRDTAYVTWTLVSLNALIYIWDRGGAVFAPGQAFADLVMRPREVVLAVTGKGDPTEMAKMFTAMFLHGSFFHIMGNILYLAAFGPNVEAAMGSVRFALYYLAWGVAAFATQIFVQPYSEVPVLGASGAIGGVLGAYFVLFPANKVRVIVPPLVWMTFPVSAFILLGVWFLAQILWPQDGVATWAHAGGFVAGMLTVLLLGGRKKLVTGETFEEDSGFDDDD
ncbi:MAG: rhomboid family intramembrane serine protease [Chthonomonadaceae bacterium]|nr:rhomboid family intramembrane serine protease [Chthonomonadaceae bacterium]